ncbi:uncharacterized protein yc1106_03286 [Curvularia clavata]|uniref:Uncharacterized protein n=1 Tax=Curvularia clavata TaxID=95742 RepID=A0A9Q9DQW9_CURCL|nr:uncharacterized protein yc1106_03286 [Curvularia clavata]
MAPPRYTRPTTSSLSKASPRSLKIAKDADVKGPAPSPGSKTHVESETRNKNIPCPNQTTPTRPSKPAPAVPEKNKGLKRPSMLTSRQKDSLAYKRDLYHITPRDPSKPCLLATLPSELRTQIYHYVLPPFRYISSNWTVFAPRKQHVPPALLQVSRAVRIEAAYTYYTGTIFHFSVRNLDFSPVISWLEHLAPPHRALLFRRRRSSHGLEINMLPSIRNTYTYSPSGWLLDDLLENHWHACQPFGNIYTVHGDLHKVHFVLFCRLAEWWRWWGSYSHRMNSECKYVFGPLLLLNPLGIPDLRNEAVLRAFLSQSGMVVAMPCVDKAWKRNRDRNTVRVMRAEGLRFLDALDECYKSNRGEGGSEEWDAAIAQAKKGMEKW